MTGQAWLDTFERLACLVESIHGGPFEQEGEKLAGLRNRVGDARVYLAAQSLLECLLELLMKQWRSVIEGALGLFPEQLYRDA
jgi:hypothetical protein